MKPESGADILRTAIDKNKKKRSEVAVPEPPKTDAEPPRANGLAHAYHFKEKIGEGGMGEVWDAVREDEEEAHVVVKVLHPTIVQSGNIAFRHRMMREAAALQDLDARHFPKFIDADPDGTMFVMEKLEGADLMHEMQNNKIGIMEALHIAREVADGMDHAHSKGYYHRDLKPQNIFVTKKEEVKILDFGVVHYAAQKRDTVNVGPRGRITREGMLLGTPSYAAPEQLLGKLDITGAVDVFSLGAMLYRMVAHKPAFTAGKTPAGEKRTTGEINQAIIAKILDKDYKVTPLNTLLPDVSKSFSDFVGSMLTYDASKRPTMAEVRDTMQHYLDDPLSIVSSSDKKINVNRTGDVSVDPFLSTMHEAA